MRKILLLLTSVMMVLGMAACGGGGGGEEQSTNTPEAAVAGYLDAFKAVDQAKLNEYVTEDDVMYSEDTESVTEAQVVFGNFTYEIKSVNTDTEGVAIVTTDITNIDMNIVMQEYMKKALEASENSTDMTQEEAMTLLKDSIAENKENTITKTVNLEVKKAEDGQWKVKTTDELNTILTGGLSEETF